MSRLTSAALVAILAAGAQAAQAEDIIFFQDFGCDGGTNDNCGAATTPQTWTEVNTGNSDLKFQSFNSSYNVTEIIYADVSTRTEENPSNFSVTGRNWDIHDGDDNPYVSGYKDPSSNAEKRNPNMSGNMLGHEDENYDHYEDNYYQIDGIVLDANISAASLMFDFDSWIMDDVDGFGVAAAIIENGVVGDFSRIDPTADSDMQYRTLAQVNQPDSTIGDASLNRLLGESLSTGADIIGYDGWSAPGVMSDMAGTAMFDLSGLAGQTVSLRFAFASNNSGSLAEGINIDNIKVTQTCISGTTPGCDPGTPGTGVPEPTSMALALLGLTFAWRRRQVKVRA